MVSPRRDPATSLESMVECDVEASSVHGDHGSGGHGDYDVHCVLQDGGHSVLLHVWSRRAGALVRPTCLCLLVPLRSEESSAW
jgi:hypothetical protein